MIHVLQAVSGVVLIAALLAVPTWAPWLIQRKRPARKPPVPTPAVTAESPAPVVLVPVQPSSAEHVPYDPGPLAIAPREDV